MKSTGAKAVLVTPLAAGRSAMANCRNDLEPWAAAARKVASEENVPVLELNAESVAAVQKMGPVEANTLAMAPPPPDIAASAASGTSTNAPKIQVPSNNSVERKGEAAPLFDYTHLGAKGASVLRRDGG